MTGDQHSDGIAPQRCAYSSARTRASGLLGETLIAGHSPGRDSQERLPHFDLEIRAAQVQVQRFPAALTQVEDRFDKRRGYVVVFNHFGLRPTGDQGVYCVTFTAGDKTKMTNPTLSQANERLSEGRVM